MSGMVNNINSSTGIRHQRLYLVLDWTQNAQTLQTFTETFNTWQVIAVVNPDNTTYQKKWIAYSGNSGTDIAVGTAHEAYLKDSSNNTYYQLRNYAGLFLTNDEKTGSLTLKLDGSLEHTPVEITSYKLTMTASNNSTSASVNMNIDNTISINNNQLAVLSMDINSTSNNSYNKTSTNNVNTFLNNCSGKDFSINNYMFCTIGQVSNGAAPLRIYEMSFSITYKAYA